MMLQVGDRVKWRPDVCVSDWRGMVTGTDGNYAICDDRGKISFGLLEKVGGMDDLSNHAQDDPMGYERYLSTLDVLEKRVAELERERDGLLEICAAQLDAIQPATAPKDETLQRLLDYYLLEVCGSSDWRASDTKLGALVNHIRRMR